MFLNFINRQSLNIGVFRGEIKGDSLSKWCDSCSKYKKKKVFMSLFKPKWSKLLLRKS